MPRKKEPIFRLPPYKVNAIVASLSQIVDWGVALLGVPALWKESRGEGIKVAVCDTGAALTHPDLRDAIDDAKDFTDSPLGPGDSNGHGTHCCGVIGARDNTSGVIGVANMCRLLVAKVLGDNGSGSSLSVSKGVIWSVDQGAHVISMSLGSPYPDTRIRKAIEYALSKGVIVVCAAGNEGPSLDTVGYPAKWPGVISVGAINEQRKVANFSSRGDRVDICAPGVNIVSDWPPTGMASLSGTSMATPHVAGVVALMLAKHLRDGGATPAKTPDQVRAHLIGNAIDLGESGKDPSYGYGLIDPAKLLTVVSPPPTLPAAAIILEDGDLTAAGRAKLTAAGLTEFSVRVRV